MTERICRLRQRSLRAVPCLSPERAVLMTEFYKHGTVECVSVPVARALAFKHVMTHKAVFIDEGELIVGERGPGPKATPTYPEICTHSPQDLDILNDREKVSFAVNDDTRRFFEKTLRPFWQGRSIRDRIFEAVDDAWKTAYQAGVFTEFMEQRAPGHTVLGDSIYKKGMLDFKADIEARIETLDFYNDPDAFSKREELKAMAIAAEALMAFARRYADEARDLAARETDPARKDELEKIAAVCRRVPARTPRTFWEALQYYWFVHLGVITELNTWDSFNPGRLDQHLYPFYKQEIDAGTLAKEEARELLQAFWIKFNNQPAPPKVGVTAQESNTYTDFCLINLGGVKPDGSDAVNELTYLLLDVIEEMRILQPSSMVQVSRKNPDRFVKRALGIVKTGFGQPSIFNTDALIQEMLRQGKSLADARAGGASGCVETGAFGKEAYILTGYFNLVKVMEITLHNGIDPRTGARLGLGTITDAMTAIKEHVFDRKTHSMTTMLDALAADFEGREALRQTLLHDTPKYGNDDDAADDVMRRIFEVYFDAIDGRPNTRGGVYRINLLPTTCHVYFGSVVGATPDGRRAFTPLSEGISPVQGADRNGPTAVIKSAAKIDHLRTGGTLLNQKFTPDFLKDDDGITKLTHLIRSYFKMDGHHIQFNVVTAETLREAQKHPEKHADLVVRVAGYSDYFVDLGADLQNEIIKRTEQVAC